MRACVLQVGHDGLLHVSLSCLVYIRLHPADWSSGTDIRRLSYAFILKGLLDSHISHSVFFLFDLALKLVSELFELKEKSKT